MAELGVMFSQRARQAQVTLQRADPAYPQAGMRQGAAPLPPTPRRSYDARSAFMPAPTTDLDHALTAQFIERRPTPFALPFTPIFSSPTHLSQCSDGSRSTLMRWGWTAGDMELVAHEPH